MNVTSVTPKDAIKVGHRKENNFRYEYALYVSDEDRYSGSPVMLLATLRIYGTYSNFACLWINSRSGVEYMSGSGHATGGNYHLQSEAAEKAFRAAGVEFDDEIGGGRGSEYIRLALYALGRFLGYESHDLFIHEAHA